MKVAIIHDWLVTYAGAERVLEQLLALWPEADLFTLVDFLPEDGRGFVKGKRATTTWIQHLPFAKRFFRHYLPLFPFAIRMLDVSGYDLIISSSHCMAKNVRVRPGQRHVCYCHSPVRYAWDMQDEYLAQVGLSGGLKGRLIKWGMRFIRWADLRYTPGVGLFVANSHFIAQRIWACYGREAMVLNPPVAVQDFPLRAEKDGFYLTASRLVPYKKMDLIVQAFAGMPDKRLVVIGDGPEMPRVRQAAEGAANIEVRGYQPFGALKEAMQAAKAFVFAAKEDFGITPVEAMACGTPVIAYGEGGVQDSVVPLPNPEATGVFFPLQTVDAVQAAVRTFEAAQARLTPEACRQRAESFGEAVFRDKFKMIVEQFVK